MAEKRNGKIELLRFVFCIIILFYHISHDYVEAHWMIAEKITFFSRGWIGVEFFFIVTGYVTASSIWKNRDTKPEMLGMDTWHFIWKKIKAILPYHLIGIVMMFLLRLIIMKVDILDILFNSLPNIVLLQMVGYQGKDLLGAEWYISAMLLMLCIIYPIAVKHYDVFVRIAAPLSGVLLTGFLMGVNGRVTNSKEITGFLCNGNMRAFAEISLGMFIFEVVRNLKKKELSKATRVCVTILEMVLYALILFFTVSEDCSMKYYGSVNIMMVMAIAISFSGISYGSELFNNRFCYFLGKCSLPIYLIQNFIRSLMKHYIADLPGKQVLMITAGSTVLLGCILYVIVSSVQKNRRNLREHQSGIL